MSSDDSNPSHKLSLAQIQSEAAAPSEFLQQLSPTTEKEVERFQDFYGLVGSALWDLFLTGHVEEEDRLSYDYFFVPMPDCYFIAICSGSFEEVPHGKSDLQQLSVCKDDWVSDDHDTVNEFFADLNDIVDEHSLSGIVLSDMEDMFTLKANNPLCLLKLIEIYLKKHDVLTLDEIRPEDLNTKSKKMSADDVKNHVKALRKAAQYTWDTDYFSVASPEHISIKYFPVAAAPTIDNADIMLVEAELVEETAPFSLDLIKNTYRDCLGVTPKPHCGLALLH